MSELLKLSATAALKKLKAKEVSSLELTEAHLARIEKRKHLNAYITVNAEGARKAAKAADEAIAKGQGPSASNPLTGLPIAVKDLYCTNGLRTTAGSKFLDNFVPAYESTVSAKLWAAGAVNLGKLNMDEFAMGGSGENSAYGPTGNPWDSSLVPGGSSSGSSAAVADYQCYAATGSDTGGSIRQPAAFTGLVGIKPTYGRCSRWGMVAFGSSLDQAGVLTRTTEDAAMLMEIIAGHDPLDSTSSPQAVPQWLGSLGKLNLKGLRIGLPKEYFIEGLDPKIRAMVEGAAKKFEAEGATVKQISLPHTKYAPAAYYIVAPAEAASNLARYDGIRFGIRAEGKNLTDVYLNSRTQGFGAEVKRRIMIGNYALSSGYYDAFYTKAMQIRTLISQDFDEAFKEVDVIFAPTAPTAAFKIGAKSNDPVAMYLGDVFTIPTSLAGLPGLSVCGGTVTENGVELPIGLQLIGPRWNETVLLQVSHAWEQLSGVQQPPFQS